MARKTNTNREEYETASRRNADRIDRVKRYIASNGATEDPLKENERISQLFEGEE